MILAANLHMIEAEMKERMTAFEFQKWQRFAVLHPEDERWWPRMKRSQREPTAQEILGVIESANGNDHES